MDQEHYMTSRVDDQLKFYEGAATKAKKIHIGMQSTIIILGVLVPVIINLPSSFEIMKDMDPYVRALATLMSLSLAILTGISNFRKYGDLWLSYRMTEELLKHEKYLFLTSSGPYHENSDAYNTFVKTIESIISTEHSKFRAIIEESKRPTAEEAEND